MPSLDNGYRDYSLRDAIVLMCAVRLAEDVQRTLNAHAQWWQEYAV